MKKIIIACFVCLIICLSGMESIQVHAQDTTELEWLISVYLCGSDLESEGAMASSDLQEMLAASTNGRAAFFVEAGGSAQWQNEGMESEKQNRFLIMDGEQYGLDSPNSSNMGEQDTLTEFLRAEMDIDLKAEHKALVFWDHGSGSIKGVCFDENYGYDSLTLQEIQRAFAETEVKFDLVGFDACLMSSYETAYMLHDYADYMVASEELEPGYGWNYERLGDFLGQSPETVLEVGREICDGFYESCEEIGAESMATLSVVNLQEFQKLVDSFDAVAEKMAGSLQNPAMLGNLSRGIIKSENYGGNNAAEGYTNMVDLGDILKNISEMIPEAKEAYQTLTEIVVYQVHGSDRQNATGLSIYYPLKVEDSEEIQTFESGNPSRNYVEFTKGMLYGAVTGTTSDYSIGLFSTIVEEAMNAENGETIEIGGGSIGAFSSMASEDGNTEVQQNVNFEVEPFINEDGYYEFALPTECLDYVQTIGLDLFQEIAEEEGIYYYLGNDNNVNFDWESGVGEDNFSGIWPSLPDGQELLFYMLEETDEYTLFTAPVYFNGEEKYLRFSWHWENPDEEDSDGWFVVIGIWDGLDEESGASARTHKIIEVGDEICPIYYGYDENDNEEQYCGETCLVDSDFMIEEKCLREGIYTYYFDIVDIFGNSLYSEPIEFYVDEDGEIELL